MGKKGKKGKKWRLEKLKRLHAPMLLFDRKELVIGESGGSNKLDILGWLVPCKFYRKSLETEVNGTWSLSLFLIRKLRLIKRNYLLKTTKFVPLSMMCCLKYLIQKYWIMRNVEISRIDAVALRMKYLIEYSRNFREKQKFLLSRTTFTTLRRTMIPLFDDQRTNFFSPWLLLIIYPEIATGSP